MKLLMLDHIIILVASLADFQKDFGERYGVELTQGGAHPYLGTANLLADLGNGTYLEVLGPNPDLESPTGMGEMLVGYDQPQVTWFAVATDHHDQVQADAEAAGLTFLGPSPGSRESAEGKLLQWSSAIVAGHGYGEQVPFFIDWGDTRHPSQSSAKGLELLEFTVLHPQAQALASIYEAVGIVVPLETAEKPGFRLRINTPHGEVSYESYPVESVFLANIPGAEASN